MNRDALKAWLEEPGKTWRWNAGDADGYEAVEVRGASLRWYSWSHDHEGTQNEEFQSVTSFLTEGPPRPAPEQLLHALRDHLRAKST